MARNRKKIAFYEVISKSRLNSSYAKTLEQSHSKKPGKDEPAVKSDVPVSERLVKWPRKPRIVQFNDGRIEFSLPYQIAIAVLLGVVLLVLVIFRMGQITYLRRQKISSSAAETPKSVQKVTSQPTAGIAKMPAGAEKVPLNIEKAGLAKPGGNNRIVIQTYNLRPHLVPVKEYFAQFGIGTEIRKEGDWYYLVTKDKYKNPEKQGTDGYFVKQKIVKLGAKYKAPPGYETFGSKPFHDAFGKRFDD